MQLSLPGATLHRFPGAPRPGIDVDIYAKDGLLYVSSSPRTRKGASFLRVDDTEVAGRSFHAAFKGQCYTTEPGMQLSAGFSMAGGTPLRWPPPVRGVPRRDQEPGKVIGMHYSLVPLVDMPLEEYAAEVERVKTSVCGMAAAAEGAGLAPADSWLEPSDGLMVWVAYALRELSKASAEPASVRTTAWLLLATVCAADMTFEELLLEPDLAAWALAAMERYEPPDGDPVAESDCWHVELQLREALTAPSLVEEDLGRLCIESDKPQRMLIGAHVPRVAADQRVREAVTVGLRRSGAWSAFHPSVQAIYACGSACVVVEVDADPLTQIRQPPGLQLQLNSTGGIEEAPADADGWFVFTDAVSDDAGCDGAFAVGEPWGVCSSGERELRIAIPPPDVDAVFGTLPARCKAEVKREKRRCKNRSSRTNPERCYCHLDTARFPDWTGPSECAQGTTPKASACD